MKLHEDKDFFQYILRQVSGISQLSASIFEKDYYVMQILKEVADKQQNGLPCYFKGGTALYKALNNMIRFSEDIDLSVDVRGLSNNQKKVYLNRSAKQFVSLPRDKAMSIGARQTTEEIYPYNPISDAIEDDELERIGKVKVEATSFNISEPVETIQISSLIYQFSDEQTRSILASQYELAPFDIKIITLQRLFVDKLFAAEAYTRRSDDEHRAVEAAKHIYDLHIMKNLPVIVDLMNDMQQMQYLLRVRLEEETVRKDGVNYLFSRGCNDQDIAENSGLSTNQVKELRRAFIYKGNSIKKDTSIAPH